jgi:hypothetical protein
MPRKENIEVVKIPSKETLLNHPQIFPRMPRLYLELIENKNKIKQNLVNKEYIPNDVLLDNNIISQQSENIIMENNEQEDDIENNDIKKRIDNLLNSKNEDYESDYSENNNKLDYDSDYSNYSKDSKRSVKSDDSISTSFSEKNSKDSSEDLSSRLKELLNDSSSSASLSPENFKKKDKYSVRRDINGKSIEKKYSPPTLSQLEKEGGYIPTKQYPDINQQNLNEHEMEDSKREILFKFDLLRKSYPGSVIPEYTIHTDYTTMEKSYNDCVRRLSLDSSVENYKTYLVYGFMGCEFVLGNFFGFDMQGFTQQQIVSMNSYEKLLIELGEKSYIPTGSKWPVELRLLFMIIMNAAFFIISKLIMKKTGANILGMVNGMATSNVNRNVRKRKMKPPSFNVNDLPEDDMENE